MRPAEQVISDHALLRWLERVCGFEMEFFRQQLHDAVKDALASGCTNWRNPKDGATYTFRDGRLVTVHGAGMKPGLRGRSDGDYQSRRMRPLSKHGSASIG